MKKSFIGPLLTVIAVALMGAMFIYFYITLNRLEKRVMAVQTTYSQDSAKITQIVNFFNANANAQTNKK